MAWSQRRRDLRHDAEPRIERRPRLVEQKTEAVHRDVAAGARRGQERRLGRHVDQVADERVVAQPIERNIERRLAGRAEARRIGEHGNAVERIRAPIPRHDLHHGSDGIGDLLRLVERAVGHAYLCRTLRREARHDRACRAARAQHEYRPAVGTPVRMGVAQALDEAVAVVVEAGERAILFDDDGVDRADLPREVVDPVEQREDRLLVRRGDIAAAQTERARSRARRRFEASPAAPGTARSGPAMP